MATAASALAFALEGSRLPYVMVCPAADHTLPSAAPSVPVPMTAILVGACLGSVALVVARWTGAPAIV